jgi:hypothetical protein
MKARLVTGGAILATLTLVLSGCSLGGSGLSEACTTAVEDTSREFVVLLEDASSESGTPDINALGRVVDDVETACKDDNSSESMSALLASISRRAEKVQSADAQGLIYFSLDLVCDQMRKEEEFTPTQEAKDACQTASVKGSDFLLGATGTGGSDSGDIFGSDGPAIGDVNTDLEFPGTSGTVAGYTFTYVVDGVGTAFVTYIDAKDEYRSGTVTLPWQISDTTNIDYLSVSASGNQEGQISCAVYVDGVELDKYSDSGVAPGVSCFSTVD